jgi:hypothetical protein
VSAIICAIVMVSGGMSEAKRHARAALLPPDHGEVALEPGGIVLLHEELDHARAAVQEQEHRVRGIDALDDHALRDAADLDGHALREAAGDDVAGLRRAAGGSAGADGEEPGQVRAGGRASGEEKES